MAACYSKSRITNVEATVVQLLNKVASRDRAVFDPGCPFLLLFWASKKVNKKYEYTN